LFSGLIGVRPQTRRSLILTLKDTFSLWISLQLLKTKMKRMMREEMSSLMINHLKTMMKKRVKETAKKRNLRH
jgi:hypothetical protein